MSGFCGTLAVWKPENARKQTIRRTTRHENLSRRRYYPHPRHGSRLRPRRLIRPVRYRGRAHGVRRRAHCQSRVRADRIRHADPQMRPQSARASRLRARAARFRADRRGACEQPRLRLRHPRPARHLRGARFRGAALYGTRRKRAGRPPSAVFRRRGKARRAGLRRGARIQLCAAEPLRRMGL